MSRRFSLPVAISLALLVGCGRLPTEPKTPKSSLLADAETSINNRRRTSNPSDHITPPCQMPARLIPATPSGRAPGYLVRYKDGVDSATVTAELSVSLSFTPKSVWGAPVPGFSADLSEQALAALRCDARVHWVEENAWLVFGNR